MHFLYYLTAFASLASAMTIDKRKIRDPDRTCDGAESNEEFDSWSLQAAKAEAEELNVKARDAVTITTWFHVVAAGTELEDGWVPDERIEATLDRMNSAYAEHGFGFELAGITRTVDKDLSYDNNTNSLDRGRKLRKGDYKTLNIYIVEDLSNNAAGRCTYPSTNYNSTTVIARDGCRIAWDTLPPGRNNGITAIHEVGHWLGLRHTFNEGLDGEEPTCDDGTGDLIDDTPVHLVNRSCGEEVDTCPGYEGKDPLRNFMNYTGTCRIEFTPGQEKRMHSAWSMRVQASPSTYKKI